jgi:hypothetical protein
MGYGNDSLQNGPFGFSGVTRPAAGCSHSRLGRLSREVEGVVAEAVDVFGQIRADGGDSILGNGFASLLQGLDEPGERAGVVKDQAVCDEVVLFDAFTLLVSAVFGDDALPSEESPLEKAVEGFALVGGALDGGAQVGV